MTRPQDPTAGRLSLKQATDQKINKTNKSQKPIRVRWGMRKTLSCMEGS